MIDILHYFPETTQHTILKNSINHLNKSGILFVRDGDKKTGLRYIITYLFEFFSLLFRFTKAKELSFCDFESYENIIIKNGLKTETSTLWGKTFFGNKLLIARKV
jgi:hypothetical protein